MVIFCGDVIAGPDWHPGFCFMSDPFESPKRLIAWANKNILDLKDKVEVFFKENPYEKFVEPDSNKPGWFVAKARLKKPLPDYFSETVADILDDMRSALDQTLYAIAALDGDVRPGKVYFPFSSDETTFLNTLNGRCPGRLKALHPLLIRLKPYKGGNETLWSLNTLRGTQHAFLVPAFSVGYVHEAVWELGGGNVTLPAYPVWDSTKNEIELFTIGPQSRFKGNFKLAVHITFGEVEGVAGKDVGYTLETFLELVKMIVNEIEAESTRLGILK
jgi:hypothetical protein